MIDPKKLAETAVTLNLQLMRWRIMPSLNLEKVSKTKCLLIGSGTLGCNVARCLMGWGVREINFIDNGRVSYSNPARQSLFTFEDSKNQSYKAKAAADNLKKIYPAIKSEGFVLTIPMPGHAVTKKKEQKKVCKTVDTLDDLIQKHDAIFLLTDSRESRWLPSMLCSKNNKICINAALGFDTFVVMRHGLRTPSKQKSSTSSPSASSSSSSSSVKSYTDQPDRLGCYFCNDVVAPQDSLTARTLDQQCTVTRPGVSVLASSLATEFLVSILQHPLGASAPADTKTSVAETTQSPLGLIPHQIRGYLTHFQNLLIVGHAYNKCTACSEAIITEYESKGTKFILDVLNEPAHLEKVSGLSELKETNLDIIGWDSDDFSDDDF